PIASILVLEPPEHVVQQSLAHGAIRNTHLLHAQHIEDLGKDDRTTRKHRPAILGDGRQSQLPYVAGIHQILERTLQSDSRDGQTLRLQLPDRIPDGPDSPGAARAMLPPASAKCSLYRLELQTRSHPRTLDSLRGNLAVAEKTLAERHAAHLQAF